MGCPRIYTGTHLHYLMVGGGEATAGQLGGGGHRRLTLESHVESRPRRRAPPRREGCRRQVEANREQLARAKAGGLRGLAYDPEWIEGDGEDIVELYLEALRRKQLAFRQADFICTCPPYFDLEVYDGGANDLSMLPSYDAFLVKYSRIIKEAAKLLRPTQLAAFVVGNVRDKNGITHSMLADTISAFKSAGCNPLNTGVLLTALATAPQRAGRQMAATSKWVQVHQEQDTLVVVKGDRFTTKEAKRAGIDASGSGIAGL